MVRAHLARNRVLITALSLAARDVPTQASLVSCPSFELLSVTLGFVSVNRYVRSALGRLADNFLRHSLQRCIEVVADKAFRSVGDLEDVVARVVGDLTEHCVASRKPDPSLSCQLDGIQRVGNLGFRSPYTPSLQLLDRILRIPIHQYGSVGP